MSDGFSPDELVRIMIRNCTHDEIASGRFHVYRGVLSLEGKYLLSLWNHFVDEFVAEGKMTEDERRSDREYLSEQISSAG
jgi:hypothetical protein